VISGPDRTTKNVSVRIAKDYRSAALSLAPYPGAKPAKRHSDLEEAKNNIRHVWSSVGGTSRFSDGNWPVLYTARLVSTACAEVGYHLQEVYLPAKIPGTLLSVPHVAYRLNIAGKRRSLSMEESHFPTLCGSSSHRLSECWNIARRAISDGIDYLRAPSARKLGKACYPVLQQSAASAPYDEHKINIEIADRIDAVEVVKNSRRRTIKVCREF
jgi:hypothetical protein